MISRVIHVETVAVIGAGVMGVGVAQALAQSGFRVVLCDVSDEILRSALRVIAVNLRLGSRSPQRTEKPEGILSRIEVSTNYEPAAQADFVIENVTEKIDAKQGVYSKLDRLCRPECVFAANTSAIPITRIASMTERPTLVLGIHFMNPVCSKPTAEVIRGFHTSDETIEAGMQLLSRMGKEGIVVNDSPGFVSNRVLMLTINEAIFLLQEKIALTEAIDAIFKNCFGHKMGPLETADLIGLDTVLLSIEVLFDQFRDSKFRPCPLLQQMVSAGLHGRKSGRGFYEYL